MNKAAALLHNSNFKISANEVKTVDAVQKKVAEKCNMIFTYYVEFVVVLTSCYAQT